jgi:type IV secretion system protein VirB4
MGLEDTAIEQIAVLPPQGSLYYELRGEGQRPIDLRLSPLLLDCLARNTAEDHRLIEAILQQEGREGFAAGWMRHHGHEKEWQDVGDDEAAA